MSEEHNPYAPPQVSVTFEPEAGEARPAGQYRSTQTIAKVVVVLLAVTMFVDIVAMASSAWEIQLLSNWAGGAAVDEAQVNANDTRQLIVGISQLSLVLLTGICFLVWFYRSHKNLPALAAQDLKYSPGWAVGGWFVPFLNLVRPYQVMQEIWRNSDPAKIGSLLSGFGGGSSLVGWWWALWIISGILGQISFRLAMWADTIDAFILGDWIDMANCVISLLCATAAILIVRNITTNQSKRRAALSSATAPA